MPGFPLTTSPWIRVMDTTAGSREVGLIEALTRAHELRLIPADRQESAVVLRLLLAVYDAAAGPADDQEWDNAWQAQGLDHDGRVTAYLARWEDRFDLFHPTRPFAQCGHLVQFRRTPDVLDPAYLGGNGGSWFNERLRDPAAYPPHPPAQAARYLLTLLGYDVAGIKGAPGGDKTFGAKVGQVGALPQLHVLGQTLKDTVLLNLPPRPRSAGDRPEWERDCPEPGVRVRTPTGRLDYLTWPARRIRLRTDDLGRVDAVAWHDGDRVEGDNTTAAQVDDLAAWRATGKGKTVPLTLFDAEFGTPVPWLVAQPLHPDSVTDNSTLHGGTLHHVLAAARRRVLPPDFRLRVAVSAAIYNVHYSVLTDVRGGVVDLGQVGVHLNSATAPWLTHVIATTIGALKTVRAAAAAMLPHINRVGDRISLDPGATAKAWDRLLRGLGEQPPDEASSLSREFGRVVLDQLRHSTGRLPVVQDGSRSLGGLLARVDGLEARYATLPTRLVPAPAPRRRSPGSGRRPSPPVTIGGETKTLAQWAADPRCQVTKAALRQRLQTGWPPEQALTTPARARRHD